MRTVTPPLEAAQRAASVRPLLKVELRDDRAGVRRLGWQQLYSGADTDTHHGIACPDDGSLTRARRNGTLLEVNYIAAPDETSDFTNWVTLGTAANNRPIAISANGVRVALIYCSTATQMRILESTDSGKNYAAAVNVGGAAASNLISIGIALRADGDMVVFYTMENGALYIIKRTAGVWGAHTNSGKTFAAGATDRTTVGAHYYGDYNAVVCGLEAGTGDSLVWTVIYGDGFNQLAGAWSPLREVYRAKSGSNVVYSRPFLDQPDTYRLSFRERYTGSSAYTRPNLSHLPLPAFYFESAWREPVPFNSVTAYGLALAHTNTHVWASTPFGVWRASSATAALDVSADVLEAKAHFAAALVSRQAGSLELTLDNSDGAYNTLPTQLHTGSEVWVYLGAHTADGPLYANPWGFWVQNIQHTSGQGKALLAVRAYDGWGLLEQWRSSRPLAFTATTVQAIHTTILGKVGLYTTPLSSSTPFTAYQPPFVILPGESGASALRRLLQHVQDVTYFLRWNGNTIDPLASDASTYSYGGSGQHPLAQARFGSGILPQPPIVRAPVIGEADAPAPDARRSPWRRGNRVQVFGDPSTFGETFDWDDIVDNDGDTILAVHDPTLASAADAAARAAVEQRRLDMLVRQAEIVTPVNCGQDLYDVVTITDGAAGIASVLYRVLEQEMHFRRQPHGKPLWQQRLVLGAP